MDVADVFPLVSAVSGEETPSVPGTPSSNVAETGASAHPEDPPGQPDPLHRSQVGRGGMDGCIDGCTDTWSYFLPLLLSLVHGSIICFHRSLQLLGQS